jgi:hypothetical protein
MAVTHEQVGAAARISAVVGSWPDVEVGPNSRGALAFRLGRRELGHLHGDRSADIAFPRRIRDELIASGKARPHSVLPDSGWINFPIDSEQAVERAIELFQIAYQRARNAAARAEANR